MNSENQKLLTKLIQWAEKLESSKVDVILSNHNINTLLKTLKEILESEEE